METQLTSRIDIFLQVVDKERVFGVCLKTVDQDPVNLFFGFNQFFVSRDDLALEIPKDLPFFQVVIKFQGHIGKAE